MRRKAGTTGSMHLPCSWRKRRFPLLEVFALYPLTPGPLAPQTTSHCGTDAGSQLICARPPAQRTPWERRQGAHVTIKRGTS